MSKIDAFINLIIVLLFLMSATACTKYGGGLYASFQYMGPRPDIVYLINKNDWYREGQQQTFRRQGTLSVGTDISGASDTVRITAGSKILAWRCGREWHSKEYTVTTKYRIVLKTLCSENT